MRFAVAAALGVFALGLPPAAAAHGLGATPQLLPGDLGKVLGPGTSRLSNGLFEVRPEVGPPLTTHGPDPKPVPSVTPGHGPGFEPGDLERPPVCATHHHQHVLYARPASAPDRYAEVAPQLRAIVRRMNAVLNADSIASGGAGADYRVRCDLAGEIAVDALVTSGSSFAEIVSSARAAGFASPLADYTIFFDGKGPHCGFSSFTDDERPGAANRNNLGGGYAVTYSDCWFGVTPMHESSHNMGAVQYGSPHSTGSGAHCNEGYDVMCYSPDGGDRNQTSPADSCLGRARYDCNFDDYFDAAPEPGEYLASHWNLGSPQNQFIAFAGAAAPLDPALERIRKLRLNGKGIAGIAGAVGEWRRFSVQVPGKADAFRVSLSAPGAQLGLYLRRRRAPTEGRFDCRRTLIAGKAACRIEDPRRGRWIIGVLTLADPAGAPFTLRARRY